MCNGKSSPHLVSRWIGLRPQYNDAMRYNSPMNTDTLTSIHRPQAPTRVKTLVHQVARKIRRELGDGVTVIWFGSWVRGNASPHSDIDLAISSPHLIQPKKFAMLRNWIDDLPTLFSIDLINLNEASPSIANEVNKYGINVE